MIYIISLAFTLCFVCYSKWQFVQDRGGVKDKWHPYGMAMRVIAVASPFVMSFFPASWQDYLLAGGVNILAWDLLINKIALNARWLHVGTRATLDVKLGKKKWWLYSFFVLICAGIKILT